MASLPGLEWLVPLFVTPVFALEILFCVACGGRMLRTAFIIYVAVCIALFVGVFSDPNSLMKAVLSTPTGFELAKWPKPRAVFWNTAVVQVKALALNPADHKVVNRLSSVPYLRWVLPISPSYDYSGVVTQVGPSCDNLKVGDEVFGIGFGVNREYAVVSCGRTGKLPPNVSFVNGAAGTTTSFTAIYGLQSFKPKDVILVVGSSGGCGQAGIIYAALNQASEIICIASGKNRELSMKTGCTKFYDYKSPNFDETIVRDLKGKVDIVYDTVTQPLPIPGPYLNKLMPLLKPTGLYVCLNPSVDALWGGNLKRFFTFSAGDVSPKQVEYLTLHTEFFQDINIALQLEGLDVANVLRAYELLKSERATGKIVMTIGDQQRKR